VRVLHLVGSAVSEFYADLSCLYARGCLTATAGLHDVRIAYVSPDGRWRFPDDLGERALAAAPALPFAEAMAQVAALEPDVMVPQMFCLPGMTHYRALFDVLGIPYVGNEPAVMALTADKAKAKAVVAAAGVDVPAGEVLRRGEAPGVAVPAVVKPVDADNSHGVTLVLDPDGFGAALHAAFAHADAALVESYVELGREVRCGVLVQDGELLCLPLEEYAVDRVRGAADKLARDGSGELHLVAKERTKAWIVDADDPVTAAVWDAAKRCHVALGCRDYSLFDFRVDPAGRPFFLEAGLYCSFAEQSVIATMARAGGIPTRALFERAVRTAADRASPEPDDARSPAARA
jgi:D-alanine-D-alanine ligase